MTSRLELVTFDLDNTLWDVDSVIREAERVMREWLAERAPGIVSLTTDHYAELRAEVVREHPGLAHDVTRLRAEVLLRALVKVGEHRSSAGKLAQQALDVFLHERHKVKYFDGALDALAALAARYPLAALTNGNANVNRLGLERYFRFGISAADVGVSKPHPAMFEAALARAGSSPERAVHVGDNPVDDIRGASSAGYRTVWVNLRGIALPPEIEATREVRTLAELPSAIDAIDALTPPRGRG
jgi:putative hydrolase of the HAD superfamily